MAQYKCSVCGFIFDEQKEGKSFSELQVCPVCRQPVEKFVLLSDASGKDPEAGATGRVSELDLNYDNLYARHDESCRYMEEIHQMAVTGKSIGGSMSTRMPMPNWDDILILGAQLNPPSLEDDTPVRTMTVIGKHAKRPMILDSPVYISHMSFGALSK